jgi:hypothetical protein
VIESGYLRWQASLGDSMASELIAARERIADLERELESALLDARQNREVRRDPTICASCGKLRERCNGC